MSLRTWISSIFASPRNYEGMPRIRFYKDAAPFEQSGRILVTSPTHGLREQSVAFAFEGVQNMPLTLGLVDYIWHEARVQGFVPIAILEAGDVFLTEGEL